VFNGRLHRADGVNLPGGQSALRSARLQRRGNQEVSGLHAGAILRAGLSCGTLANPQSRMRAAGHRAQERTGGGWRGGALNLFLSLVDSS
jgi:hypothetical protein